MPKLHADKPPRHTERSLRTDLGHGAAAQANGIHSVPQPAPVAGGYAEAGTAVLFTLRAYLRTAAGLSQTELARRIGTTQSVISRLEDANYEGHSLGMLRRVAAALGKQVVLEFRDAPVTAAAEPAEVPVRTG